MVLPLRGGDRHADAVVVALLVFPQKLEIAGIEEVRVRIERPQHAGDGAFVDRLVRRNLIGKIVFHQVVQLRERFDTALDVVFRGRRPPRRHALGSEEPSENAQKAESRREQEQRSAKTLAIILRSPRLSIQYIKDADGTVPADWT